MGRHAYILVGTYGEGGANTFESMLVRVACKFFQANAVAGAAAVGSILLRTVPGLLDGVLPGCGFVGPFYHGDVLALCPLQQRFKSMLVFGCGRNIGIEVGDGYLMARFSQYPNRFQRAGPATGVK